MKKINQIILSLLILFTLMSCIPSSNENSFEEDRLDYCDDGYQGDQYIIEVDCTPTEIVELTILTEVEKDVGSFVDERDGQKYRTTTIGDQTWMGENLNYDNGDRSSCYNGIESNCDSDGRLYTWEIAMGNATPSSSNPSGVQGICPDGWHLPSSAEWKEMMNYFAEVSGLTIDVGNSFLSIAKVLGDTTLYFPDRFEYGNDPLGFGARNSGRVIGSSYSDMGISSTWWTTNEVDSQSVEVWYIESGGENFMYNPFTVNNKEYGQSVRCVEDRDEVKVDTTVVETIVDRMTLVEGGCFSVSVQSIALSTILEDREFCLSNFEIDQYEVTQGEFEKIMNTNPSFYDECGDDCPVESVDWDDAQTFCEKVNKRLPTEAEWTYAALGGNLGNGFSFSGSDVADDVAWYTDNSPNELHPVGQKMANELGLYDMSGNVIEWVSDWSSLWLGSNISEGGVVDFTGPTTGVKKMAKGGGFITQETNLDIFDRGYSFDTDTEESYLGFRCAR